MNQMDLCVGADKLHEECGVFGIYDFDGNDVASTIYYGLFALQHRGQESCGIAVSDTEGPKGKVSAHKGMGLCNEVFTPEMLEQLHGNIGVGHVRYSTAGSSTRENAQPLVLNYVKGTLALAHNGNLVNAPELRHELEYTGAIFQTTIDSEVIAYHIARARIKTPTVEQAVAEAMKKLKGAYSLVIMSPRKMIGARDPFGFKPLCIGKRDNAYILASETCALETIGAEFVRDVEPGEIVTITKKGITSNRDMCLADPKKEARCIFEYIYFARPDSVFDGVGVYHSRIQAGRFLAIDSPIEADLVVGVPESGNAAALGYSMESGIPYGTAFVKNSYVGRTFIKPKQSSRESAVRIKLNVLKEAVAGKRVIMIDDSIVRGTTSALIVNMLRDAGAKEVHVCISAPPFLHPCYFGTDIPSEDQLIAHGRTVDEIRELIGADSLSYLKLERLYEMAGGKPICTACFNGDYPIEPPTEDIRGSYEK
ncbi:amidophosphoribosyltransferase [Lacrimispora sp. 210928-DFI.3.58]|uniref:amidophosphoribosyltransferase n=1 Tax=Lacrimispora sp. 210928-DFI.3.58 TaxID=2883214 RepID=UPI0015B58A41|nr:amidophosphoribosyltransferase [Lacrimispora sp. 210928-DFI.3.58]MCB7317796.1 amidophosphoribosyltransferase [Lacrimispora sp. 210928-DFI.3.58]